MPASCGAWAPWWPTNGEWEWTSRNVHAAQADGPTRLHRPASPQVPDLVADFVIHYGNDKVRRAMARRITQLFAFAGKRDPEALTVSDCIRWATAKVRADGRDPANNTVRQKMVTASEFLAHCRRQGLDVCDPAYEFGKLRKSFPRVYGKQQHTHPARWLTRDEAFGKLLDACQDRTWTGSRDQIVCRLGLMGVRSAEIQNMAVRAIADGELRWMGKGRRQRTLVLGPTMTDLLRRWLAAYEKALGRPLRPSDPLICSTDRRYRHLPRDPRAILWGVGTTAPMTIHGIVSRRARKAGLGHVAPHDLRRTAAGLMHSDRSDDGAHRYDLGDIQKVLGHASPATTQQSYLDQLDNDAKRRASRLLD